MIVCDGLCDDVWFVVCACLMWSCGLFVLWCAMVSGVCVRLCVILCAVCAVCFVVFESVCV